MQNQLVLSLGSNQGNRLENIEKAIHAVNQTIGSVIRVSPIYETPSWGFDSDAFYNCALLVYSFLEAPTALQKILALEKQLGRIRTQDKNYSARIIDIDIISYNQETYRSDDLIIPHPMMQKRRFVLQPSSDLDYDWTHPILQKNFSTLLKECPDTASCIKVATLPSPMEKYKFSMANLLTIEGNIGAGKTTLSQKIATDFNAKLILEGFADNPFLPKFYKDPKRYAFPLEMSFLAERYAQLADDLGQFDIFKEFIVSDYYIFKSLIFAQITLEEDELRLYKQLFDIMYKETPKPGLYIYLYQSTPRLLENIQKRGRSYESDIQASYLEQLNKGYLNFIKNLPSDKVLVIDMTQIDFVSRQEDYIAILDQIQKKLTS